METSKKSGSITFRYRIHWHVWITHFPISFYIASFIFQVLHLFPHPLSRTFEIATNVMLIAGTVTLIPAVWTGWVTWKRRYAGIRATQFQRKIVISFIMLALAIALTVWRTGYLDVFEDVPYGPDHWVYLAGVFFLVIGTILEGFYGIRLTHK